MDQMIEVDVLIVGAGPAGLSCAIKMAQIAKAQGIEKSIAVLEKGGSAGDHIMSGAILNPVIINDLLPGWKASLGDFATDVTKDAFYYLGRSSHYKLPLTPDLNNQGNVIISLSKLCRYMEQEALALDVMMLSGYSAQSLCYENDVVIGVKTGDMGLDRQHQPKAKYESGVQVRAKVTILAEGCRGHLTGQVIKKFDLEHAPQNYGIGLKEVWQVNPSQHEKGLVIHSLGHPLTSDTYGGGFCYHWSENLLSIGLVVGLDYPNPYLNPFQELQKLKKHPLFAQMLKGGKPIAYGARALNEGGYQAIPCLNFPGGVLIGCGAGFLHVGQLKGIHYAMRSGVMAAEHLMHGRLEQFDQAVRTDDLIGRSLYQVRNIRPSFYKGRTWGMLYSALSTYVFRGKEPWTFSLREDHMQLKPAKDCTVIEYPKPDHQLTYPLLTMLKMTGTRHEENQPCHLQIQNQKNVYEVNVPFYDFPEGRYCPANVYELVDGVLQINASNCIHCKTCDIKDPGQNIRWVPPQGGEGPSYQIT